MFSYTQYTHSVYATGEIIVAVVIVVAAVVAFICYDGKNAHTHERTLTQIHIVEYAHKSYDLFLCETAFVSSSTPSLR